ncbi:hypothetical protein [Streptomyces capuensis]|uniref:hypothetical protein n=1 Tax=Streptomyces capuensis TaxID=1464056 RepID=UPI0004BFA0D1|nr:hypothetical protein [Streptomyces capuensis]
MPDRPRCSDTDIIYGPCTLPAQHDGECLHQKQPRCGNVALYDGHVCVLERHHNGLHANKPLAQVMPDGERMVWQHTDPASDGPVPPTTGESR